MLLPLLLASSVLAAQSGLERGDSILSAVRPPITLITDDTQVDASEPISCGDVTSQYLFNKYKGDLPGTGESVKLFCEDLLYRAQNGSSLEELNCFAENHKAQIDAEVSACGDPMDIDGGPVVCRLRDMNAAEAGKRTTVKSKCWYGVPYAAAPIGDLRFAPPVPLTSTPVWTSPKGRTFHDGCPQRCLTPPPGCPCDRESALGFLCDFPGALGECVRSQSYGTISGKEDCLTVNVFSPETSSGTSNLPVLVFFHGGSFAQSTSSAYILEGARLASKGIVVVTVNYRLGALGFLSNPSIGLPTNLGILDQIESLKWVQRNIAKFGGNPSKVTIMGESAGATSVAIMLISPLATGLFQNAILQSLPVSVPFHENATVALTFSEFMGSVGCDTVECLRTKNVSDILNAQDAAGAGIGSDFPKSVKRFLQKTQPFLFSWGYNIGPVVDGQIIPKQLQLALTSIPLNTQNILLGFNSEEGRLFASEYWLESYIPESLKENRAVYDTLSAFGASVFPYFLFNYLAFGDWHGRVINTYRPDFLGADPQWNLWQLSNLLGDLVFRCPIKAFTTSNNFKDTNTFVYLFEGTFPFETPWKLPCANRPCHVTEVAHVFGYSAEMEHVESIFETSTTQANILDQIRSYEIGEAAQIIPSRPQDVGLAYPWAATLTTADLQSMSDVMMNFWTNFVKTGNPNPEGTTEWKGLRENDALLGKRQVMMLTWPEHKMVDLEAITTKCPLWERIGYWF